MPNTLLPTSGDAEDPSKLKLFNQRDPEGVNYYFAKYSADLYVYARRLVGDVPEIEEIVHDSFLAALSSPAQFEHDIKLKKYLTTVVYRKCKQHREELQKRGIVYAGFTLPLLESAEVEDDYQRILEAAHQLKGQKKAVFFETYINGKSNQETAEKLHLTNSRIRKIKYKAIEQVKKMLGLK